MKTKRPLTLVAALVVLAVWVFTSGFHSVPQKLVSSSDTVRLTLPFNGMCQDVSVYRGDDRLVPVSKELRANTAWLTLRLEPGTHELTILYDGVLPGLEKKYPLTVVVDLEPPRLEARVESTKGENVSVTANSKVVLRGMTDPQAQVQLFGKNLTIDENGELEEDYELDPGWNHLIISARDEAGNRTARNLSVYYDAEDPVIKWQFRPDAVFSDSAVRLQVQATDDLKIASVTGLLDENTKLKWFKTSKGIWTAQAPELYEGYHSVALKAVDTSGRFTKTTRQFVIDSSESLGGRTLGPGARGLDVLKLHQRLNQGGFLSDGSADSRVFSSSTAAALKKAQQTKSLEVTGLADPHTIAALGPQIFINLRKFALVLERPGRKPLHWNIASGSRTHPTPSGHFFIAEKVVEPTWLPPKSDWARDAEPIPPGPNNPLGTRWLGFDRAGVGIHGTNAPWSIGTASSHGCMRMVTSDVERLFEMVEIGTRVVVFDGHENHPAMERYWGASAVTSRPGGG